MLRIHRNLYDAEQSANAPVKTETHEVKPEKTDVVPVVAPESETTKLVKEKTKKRKKAKKEEV